MISGGAGLMIALAGHAVREAVARRVVVAVLVVAVLVVAASAWLGALTLDEGGGAARHLGLAAIDLAGAALAIFLGVTLTARALEGGPAAAVLTRPVARWQLLAGRWLGLLAVLGAAVAVLALVVAALLRLERAPLDGALVRAVWLLYVQAALVGSLSLLLATLARPLPAGCCALGLALIGRSAPALRPLARRTGGLGGVALDALSRLLPNLTLFVTPSGAPVDGRYVLSATAYGLGYAALAVVLAAGVLRRRDLV